ncbi:pentapeptide repeat-containing protein [Candidatus Poribacteria bacterium]|nr:pentapeptide repeat-containing protein [Candidatus Poribacteria bacterium]
MAIFEEPNYTTRQFWERLTADDGDPEAHFRNCTIGDENISDALTEFCDENGNCHIYKEVICERCIFMGRISFDPITFKKRVSFNGVTFKENASFRGTAFEGDATFSGINFQDVDFNESTFRGKVIFENSTFQESAIFVEARFKKEATFNRVDFQKSSIFTGAKFYRKATFTNQTLFQETAIFAEAVFKDDADFKGSKFQEQVVFDKTEFQGNITDFENTTFRSASFAEAKFHIIAIWTEAEFQERSDFVQTWFYREADFTFTRFGQPADFKDVQYWENTTWQWILWQVGKRPAEYTRIRLDHRRINNVTNPIFQRYVADLQFIEEFREEHPQLAFLWRWSSDYGRSFRLWLVWSLMIALFFGLAYGHEYYPSGLQYTVFCAFGFGAFFRGESLLLDALRDRRTGRCWLIGLSTVVVIFFIYIAARSVESLAFNIAGEDGDLFSLPYRKPNLITYLYFSVVTFTTLGFGDITPTNTTSEIWITIEVVLGYVMLGGLISIFANKLARRS